jgi:hypothetical protein
VNTTTAKTYPCETFKRTSWTSARCGKPATQAIAKPATNYEGAEYEPICNLHLSALKRSRYNAAPYVVEFTPEVVAWIDARNAERAERQAEINATKKAESERRHEAARVQAWAEDADAWEYVYEPDTRHDWDTRDAIEVPRWLVRIKQTDGDERQRRWDAWEVIVKHEGDMPAVVDVRRAGSATPRAAAMLAEAIKQAAEEAARRNVGGAK